MNKIKKFGLIGLLLGSLALNVSACKDYRVPVDLPNNYETMGVVRKSEAHQGSLNIYSYEPDLEEKSRVTGEITYLGFAKNEDQSVSINNINQNAELSGISLLSDAENNMTIYDNMGIIIKIKTDYQEYIFNLKTQDNILPPSIILEKYKEGDRVSIPTVREYESCDGGALDNRFNKPAIYRGYRILNEIDYIYLHEIQER